MSRERPGPDPHCQDLFENSPDLIFTLDLEGHVLAINPTAAKIYGATADDLIGQPLTSALDPESIELAKRKIAEKLAGDRSSDPYEILARTSDSVRVWLEVSSWLIEEDGAPQAIQVVARDITSRKQAEEECEVLRTALQDERDRIRFYLDLVAHDLNNLNQTTMGMLELMIGGGGLSAENAEYARIAFEQVSDSSRLLSQVRRLAIMEISEIDVEPRRLGDSIEEALRSTRNMSPDTELEVSIDPAVGEAVVNAGDLLVELFTNLLGNAVKHGGGPDAIIEITCLSQEDGVIEIGIADHGQGIPDLRKEQVFARFSRGLTSTAGSGLGLAIVRRIIEDFGGRVWVEDRVAGDHTQGTRFCLRFKTAT